jgi:hypothetical protein
MAYYIFLKSLKSLEEFRKILMSKFLLNLLVQISKALINSKIQFLIQKILFPCFWPGRPCGPLGLWPSRPPLASLLPQAGPSRSAHVSMTYLWKYIFPFDSRLSRWPPPSHLSVKWARAISLIFLPRRPTVATFSHRLRPPRAARPLTSRCPSRYSLHALIPPLNFTP